MAIPDLLSSDPVSEYRSKINEMLDVVNIAARDISGTLAGRPAANSVEEGTYYFATDTAVAYRSDGATWSVVGVRPTGTIAGTELEDEAVDTAQLAGSAVTAAKLADAAKLGLSDGTSVRRGKSVIATEESRTNTAFGTLTTPDEISDVVLESDGLIFVAVNALWKESVAGAGQAAIFLGANQLKVSSDESSTPGLPAVQAAILNSSADSYQVLTSVPWGLASTRRTTYNRGSAVTTGQALGAMLKDSSTELAYKIDSVNRGQVGPGGGGGICVIFAAAGTYDISLQFKSSSGSITAKERKLWVWTQAF